MSKNSANDNYIKNKKKKKCKQQCIVNRIFIIDLNNVLYDTSYNILFSIFNKKIDDKKSIKSESIKQQSHITIY